MKTVGPADAVAAIDENAKQIAALKEQLEIKNKKEVKPVKYAKVLFRNLNDPGLNLNFTFNGKYYNLVDGIEHNLPMDVVEHLNSLMIRKSRYEKDGSGNVRHIDEMRPRIVCQILEQYEQVK